MLRYFKKQFLYALAFFLFGAYNIEAAAPLVQSAPVTGAGGQTYQPIVEGVGVAGADVGSTLVQLFTWGVTLAIILAIIMLVIGGIQYMGSESIFAKGDGIKRIQGALGGMFIALLCIFILNLILGSGGGGPFRVGTFGGGAQSVGAPLSRNTGSPAASGTRNPSTNSGVNPATSGGTLSGVQMNPSGSAAPQAVFQTQSTGPAPTVSTPSTQPSATVDSFGRTIFSEPLQ